MTWALAIAACRSDGPPPPVPDRPDPADTGTTEPIGVPAARVLAVSPIAPGVDVTVTVRPMAPGEGLIVGWSAAAAPCAGTVDGACVDLVDPTVAAPIVADFAGAATATVRIDAEVGETVYVQAIVAPLDGDALVTDRLARPVYDPVEVWLGDAGPAQLDGYRAVTGSVRVDGGDLALVDLAGVEHVGGDLALWRAPSLRRVSAPALRWVDGDVSWVDDPALDGLALPALERVGGALTVMRSGVQDLDELGALAVIGGDVTLYDAPAVARLDSGALQRVGGGVALWELPALRTVDLSGLVGIGGKLDLFEDDALVALALPALTELGAYELHHCDAMTSLGAFDALPAVRAEVALRYDRGLQTLDGMPQVTSVGALTVQFADQLASMSALSSLEQAVLLDVLQAPALVSVDLPALARASAVSIRGNAGLTGVGLPALAEVNDVAVLDNPVLAGCAVEAWLAEVAPTGAVACAGNLADACTTVCAP